MYINNVDCDIIEMTCRQLGASQVRKIHGTLYIFEFDIGKDYKLSYSFNVNHKNEYHLHRIRPYPFLRSSITTAREVTDFIKTDLTRFQNAVQSSNFKELIATEEELLAVGQDIDSLFLNFNVNRPAIEGIRDELSRIRRLIEKVKESSMELHFEKLIDIDEREEQDIMEEIDDMLEMAQNTED